MNELNLKKWRKLIVVALAIVLIVVCAGIRLYRTVEREEATEGKLTVHFIDVGQGDAALLTFPDGTTAMIDTGTPESSSDLVAYLRRWEVERVDRIYLSHLHSDHAGGLDAICEAFEVGELCYASEPPTLSAEQAEKQIVYRPLTAGDCIESGGVTVSVLAPLAEHKEENDNSMILRVEYGDISFLFTGDAEEDEENDLLEFSPEALDADVLKVGHHGSANSTSQDFVDAVSPRVAILSASSDNSFGHPTPSVVERLQAAGAAVYSTHESGSVTLICDGKSVIHHSGDDYLALPSEPSRKKSV